MKSIDRANSRPLMILIAGAKGAVASTVAVAASVINDCPELIVPYLTTANNLSTLGEPGNILTAGWDSQNSTLIDAICHHRVLSPQIWKPYQAKLLQIPIKPARINHPG
jgi:myo-inositol-1-phosphate synthase